LFYTEAAATDQPAIIKSQPAARSAAGSTTKISGAQTTHGFIGSYTQARQGFIKFIPVGSDIVDPGLRGAVLANLLDTIIHFSDEHMKILDIRMKLIFFTT
jgi:hypothetical protein